MSDNKTSDISGNKVNDTNVTQKNVPNPYVILDGFMNNNIEKPIFKAAAASCQAGNFIVGLRQQNFKKGGGGSIL
jgi:hypothetical protein